MAAIVQDCSLAASIFAWIYTAINGILFFTSVYTLYKFCKDYRINVKKRPPKLLFYPGLIFFVFSSLALLATVRNSMTMCYHGGQFNYTDFKYWVYFITFYGAQTYLLWLVLFLRLHYVFKGSVYNLSSFTVKIHTALFILMPLFTPLYFYVLFLVDGRVYTIILAFSFLFIMAFSTSLSVLFIYKLFQVFQNMDICTKNRQKLMNHKLLSTITKSTMLAVISLSMTFLTPTTLLFGYYSIAHSNSQIVAEAGAAVLAFCSLFDVYTNYICILLSYNCFDQMYNKMCGECDKKCRMRCIEKVIQRKSTKSGHMEMSSCTSKTSITTPASQDHFMSVTPPNGGNGTSRNERFVRHQYEQVDTDYDETETTIDQEERDTGVTPFAQDNTNFEYDIPEGDEEEDDFAEEDDIFEVNERMELKIKNHDDVPCEREYTNTHEVKRRFIHDL
eukprot:44273_1